VNAVRFNGTIHDFVLLNALRNLPSTQAALRLAAEESDPTSAIDRSGVEQTGRRRRCPIYGQEVTLNPLIELLLVQPVSHATANRPPDANRVPVLYS